MRWMLVAVTVSILSGAIATAAEVERAAAEFREAFPDARFHNTGERLTCVYGKPIGFGDSPVATADTFVRTHAAIFGVAPEDLVPGNRFNGRYTQPVMPDRERGGYKFTLVYYHQFRDGLPVYGADLRLLVSNREGHPLVQATSALRDLGDFELPALPRGAEAESAAYAAALAFDAALLNFSETELMIWAGVDDMTVTPRPALVFVADNGLQGTAEEQKWRFIVDAVTGDVLHQESLIHHVDVEGWVSAYATPDYRASNCEDPTPIFLPYAQVWIGATTAYADENGQFVIPWSGTSPVTVVSEVRGLYFNVENQTGSDAVVTQEVAPPGPAGCVHNTTFTEQKFAEVNAYIQANVVRDMALGTNPDYPVIGEQYDWPVNVNIDDSCNAFYNGESINFFSSGGGCANTAFGDVVHHEYGHHLVNVGGSGQGQYGEGMSDCVGFLITNRSQLGVGFYNCDSGIRDANNTLTYPCTAEIHYCGQLLSGCVWDTRAELMITEPDDWLQILRDLTINSILLHTGNLITPQITIDFLTLDDDDGDLENGTPHYLEIATGFGNHNMDAPALHPLSFSYPDGLPELSSPSGTDFVVAITGGSVVPGTTKLRWSANGGVWQTAALTPLEDDLYEAHLPPAFCGSTLRFYLQAQGEMDEWYYDPENAPSGYYSVAVADALEILMVDDFETSLGWTVVDDAGLTDGSWERGVPAGYGDRGDPITDYDGSGQCYLTGNEPGNSDVDNGFTWLVSPVLDLLPGSARVTYALWYTNNAGDNPNEDYFRVHVSADDGDTWVLAKQHGPVTSAGWSVHSFWVDDYVTPTETTRVRFEASDVEGGSIVEAAVDAVQVELITCIPDPVYETGDMNCDGAVDIGDINPFVLALSAPGAYETQYDCDIMHGDINGDGGVTILDINPFVVLLTQSYR